MPQRYAQFEESTTLAQRPADQGFDIAKQNPDHVSNRLLDRYTTESHPAH